MTDLILAIIHHILIFGLLATLVTELSILRGTLTPIGLNRLARMDMSYGIIAGLILAVGAGRVLFGVKGMEYYIHNIFFWMKMATFALVGLCSIAPTLLILSWRRAMLADSAFAPAPAAVARARKWMVIELSLFILIPVFAAIMGALSRIRAVLIYPEIATPALPWKKSQARYVRSLRAVHGLPVRPDAAAALHCLRAHKVRTDNKGTNRRQ